MIFEVWTAPKIDYSVLRGLSNGPHFGNLPAGLRTTSAGFGTPPHYLVIFMFSALCSTGFADVCTDTAKLMRKPGISRKQSRAKAAYWRALVAEADGCRHHGRIMREALIDAG